MARRLTASVEGAGMGCGFLTLQARRILHARALATNAEASQSRTRAARSESVLFEACRAFDKLEQRKIRLLKTSAEEDPRFEMDLARLCVEQADHLSGMCDQRAVSIHGHRARAISFALYDAGDLEYRAREGEAIEDMILQAIVRDLTCGKGRP